MGVGSRVEGSGFGFSCSRFRASVTRYSFRGRRVCDLEDVMLGPRFSLGSD